MGWISKRAYETGGSVGGNPEKTRRTNRYPLREIVAVLRSGDGLFSLDRVRFSCGHEGSSWGGVRGRCKKCPPREDV